MSDNISRASVSSDGAPVKKRSKYSSDDLFDELALLESKEIKTGFVKLKSAVISIDYQEIDLLNITSDITSKIIFEIKGGENSNQSKICKSLERRLENVNSPFLNYLGQMITFELGKNYQAIPHELILFQKNDFRSPCDNIQEKDSSNFLIVVCPTDCEGGEINFPQLKRNFSKKPEKMLTYAFFGSKTQYEVSKVTKGLRVLITFKIIEHCIEEGLDNFTVFDTERLKSVLKNMTEENVLISITEKKALKEICKDIQVNCQKVYAKTKDPDTVYDNIEKYLDCCGCNSYEYFKFADLIEGANAFEVETFINLTTPPKKSEEYTKYHSRRRYGSSETNYEINYYTFLLINPKK